MGLREIPPLFWLLIGSHFSLVTYYFIKGSRDLLLHSLIFLTGVLTIMIFAISQVTFESTVAFFFTVLMLGSTIMSSLVLESIFPVKNIINWMIMAIYNIFQTRTMRLVDIQKVAKRNIIINGITTIINTYYALH